MTEKSKVKKWDEIINFLNEKPKRKRISKIKRVYTFKSKFINDDYKRI